MPGRIGLTNNTPWNLFLAFNMWKAIYRVAIDEKFYNIKFHNSINTLLMLKTLGTGTVEAAIAFLVGEENAGQNNDRTQRRRNFGERNK